MADTASPSLQEAVDSYLEQISGVRTASIVANHTSVSRRLLTYFSGRRPVDDLRRQDLLAFLDWMTNRRGSYTAHTYNLGVEFLKRLGLYCTAQGWLEESPAEKISYRDIEKSRPTTLTGEELDRLTEAARQDPLHTILVGLLGELGLKKKELMDLSFNDLKLESSPPVVVIRYSGKLRKKSRRLPLTRELVAALRQYRLLREAEGDFSAADSLVPVTGRQVNNILASLSEKAGIRRVNPQILRDTAAVHMLLGGDPPETVSDRLGYTPRGYMLEFLERFGPWMGKTKE